MNRSVLVPICTGLVLLSFFSASTGAASDRKEQNRVENIFFNGRIYTMNERQPFAEAIAISGGRVVAAGSTEELMGLCDKATRRYDLKGLTVIPGLVDAHAHFNGYALGRSSVDLTGTSSFDDITAMVSERIGEITEGEWVSGRGWDQNDWKISTYPEKIELDRVSADNPVFLVRICGHASLVNSAALELAGIDRNTPDPPGGLIMRGADGDPSGILIDEAVELVRDKICLLYTSPSPRDRS